MSISGIRAPSPTITDPTSSAMKAGSRSQVMNSTTRPTPIAAINRREAGFTGVKAGQLNSKAFGPTTFSTAAAQVRNRQGARRAKNGRRTVSWELAVEELGTGRGELIGLCQPA